MQFGPVPLHEAEGKILAHNLAGSDGVRLLHKGKVLAAADIEMLQTQAVSRVFVAWLEEGDVDENEAAQRTAQAIGGDHIELSRAAVGRVNLRAVADGVLRIDTARLAAINSQDGIAVATLPMHSVVKPKKIVATVKIIPFGIANSVVQAVEALGNEGEPLIKVDALSPQTVGLLLVGSPGLRERLAADFSPLADRITALGSQVIYADYLPLTHDDVEQTLADRLVGLRQAGVSLILIAGETAIMHRNDRIPCAVERAGGMIECIGAPVEPGNLLMVAYLDHVPVLGAPGCSRSPRSNVVDQVIPRLLVGERLTRADIIALAHGGLLAG